MLWKSLIQISENFDIYVWWISEPSDSEIKRPIDNQKKTPFNLLYSVLFVFFVTSMQRFHRIQSHRIDCTNPL